MDKPSGIIPALGPLTDTKGMFDEDSERSLVRTSIEWGVSGVAVSIIAGEFYKFTDNERKRTFEVAVDEANGKAPVWPASATSERPPQLNLRNMRRMPERTESSPSPHW